MGELIDFAGRVATDDEIAEVVDRDIRSIIEARLIAQGPITQGDLYDYRADARTDAQEWRRRMLEMHRNVREDVRDFCIGFVAGFAFAAITIFGTLEFDRLNAGPPGWYSRHD